ncbi:MAG: Rpn family recombination-promoting nuclease/putative transposase [Pirellulaceae bacterium]
MSLGIKPTVDFAFKKIFGSPENAAALIGLLNAILKFPQPIVAVEILNPFSYQEFADSKLIVLDVRCRDSAARWLNVEMQVSVYAGLIERLVYYASSMFVDQLSKGSSYAVADPALSICLLNHVLFRDTCQAHHRFQMIDRQSGRELQNAIEVHTVELLKYNLDESTICRAASLTSGLFCYCVPRITRLTSCGDFYRVSNSRRRSTRFKSSLKRRRTSRCTTSVREPNVTTSGHCPVR